MILKKFYPKKWRGTKWIRYTIDSMHEILPIPGCYVVYINDKLSYVGQSINLKSRIGDYSINYGYGGLILTPFGQASEFLIKIKYWQEIGDWAMLEVKLIDRLKPAYNYTGAGKKRRAIV